MQFKKAHVPLTSRTASQSYSLANRNIRKKTTSTQTDQRLSPFENCFESDKISHEELTFNEETTKTYSMALEYVNSFHSYMNQKLGERYGECGDIKAGFFKFPEVPNYASVFLMLLEQTQKQELQKNVDSVLDNKFVNAVNELETKKYSPKESVIEFVPEIKKLAEYKVLEENDVVEQIKIHDREVQTNISQLTDYETSYPLESTSKRSSNIQSLPSEECSSLPQDNTAETNIRYNEEKGEKLSYTFEETVCLPTEQFNKTETDLVAIFDESRKEKSTGDKTKMMEMIRKRIQEEINTYLNKNKTALQKNETMHLMKSHFHVVNIPPQINLLEYAQKKLERQLTSEPKSLTTPCDPGNRIFNKHISVRKCFSIKPNATNKVSNMFQQFSQRNIRGVENTFEHTLNECNQSDEDDDSVILDDEEFEKINGHVKDYYKRQKRNSPVDKERSNPLKLTLKDMIKVDEKMLSTIGLFTERGDIRPGVIDILEEQKKLKAKDARNKQFRSRRQWDLQVHLNPKEDINSSLTTVSSEKSFISVSAADLRLNFENTQDMSQQVEYEQ